MQRAQSIMHNNRSIVTTVSDGDAGSNFSHPPETALLGVTAAGGALGVRGMMNKGVISSSSSGAAAGAGAGSSAASVSPRSYPSSSSPSRSPKSMPASASPLGHGSSAHASTSTSRPAPRLPTIPSSSGSPTDHEGCEDGPGAAVDNRGPSPKSSPMAVRRSKPEPIPIPSSFSSPYGLNAAAGPSSEGAMGRRPSEMSS